MENQSNRAQINKSRIVCIALVLLMAMLPLGAMASAAPAYNATVDNPYNNGCVILRATAGYDGISIGSYAIGTPMVVLEQTLTWWKVAICGQTGYMHSDYVRMNAKAPVCPTPVPVPTAKPVPPVCPTAKPVPPVCPTVRPAPYVPSGKPSGLVAIISTNTGRGLNLRDYPSACGKLIASYPAGTYVSVLTRGQSWYKVQIGNAIGYMDARYLKIVGSSNPAPAPKPVGNQYGIVNNPSQSDVLNLREAPSTSSKMLAQYRSGQKVQVLAQGSEWLRVKVSGITGFMQTKYVTLVGFPTTAYKKVVNSSSNFVNLRSGAGSQFEVITRVNVGAKVEILVPDVSWSKVNVAGTVGYMMNGFLR